MGLHPNPVVYAKYVDYGITISEDGAKLLYHGRPVRLFADDGADGEVFYLDVTGNENLSAVRSAAGEITGIESITEQKAQEYQNAFFAEELGDSIPKAQDIAKVQEGVPVGPDKYEEYQSAAEPQIDVDALEKELEAKMEALYPNGMK